MKNKKHAGLILEICLILTLAGFSSVKAATLEVGISGYPYTSIQAAINDAVSGVDEVLVHAGTYYENINFNGKAIKVYTTEGAAIDGNNSGSVVSFNSGEGSGSVLDGFTIQNGLAQNGGGIYLNSNSSPQILNCTISGNTASSTGGGIYCHNSSSPQISDCTISGNSGFHGGGISCSWFSAPNIINCVISSNTSMSGGGIFGSDGYPTIAYTSIINNNTDLGDGEGGAIYGEYSSFAIDNCTISGNSAARHGGGIYLDYSPITITGSTISNNTANIDGGGICGYNGSPMIITSCTIEGNSSDSWGGGIFFDFESSLTMTNSIIRGNSATNSGGGVYCDYDTPFTITNSIITGNVTGANGGGIACERMDYYSQTIANCTISGNQASYGGGIYSYNSTIPLRVVNSILWGNAALIANDEIYLALGSTIDITYSDIQGGWAGAGNIDADPFFVNPRPASEAPTSAGDYHLGAGSPCIDKGTDDTVTYPTLPPDDIDGDTRPQDITYDMGADEYVLTCTDNDEDGYAVEGGACGEIDCNDSDPGINPGACDIKKNGIDEDCDGQDRKSGPPC